MNKQSVVYPDLDSVLRVASQELEPMEAEMFQRYWANDLDIYRNRLRAIGFQDLDHILDAGFGLGQWAVALAEMNKNVAGIEYSQTKFNAVNVIRKSLGIDNLKLSVGSIENMPYDENRFDAIFCYGVIFLTDFRKSLAEFFRVLKPGGTLYLTANGLGWFLMCLFQEHNKSNSYDPRQVAIDTLQNTMNYFSRGVTSRGLSQIFVNRDVLSQMVMDAGFNDISIDYEGHYSVSAQLPVKSFYPETTYLGEDNIYEVICSK